MKEEFIYPHTPYLFYIPSVYHHCRLDNFDFVGQKHLIKVIKKFLENKDSMGLFLYGGFGVGKSHLLVSLYRIKIAQEDDASPAVVRFETFENIVKELRRIVKEEEKDEYFEELAETDDLFIDDITTLLPKETETLRRIINDRYENQKRTSFTSNHSLNTLVQEKYLHGHAISRLEEMCEIIEITGRDRRRKR